MFLKAMLSMTMATLLLGVFGLPVRAHRPFCEGDDLEADSAWKIGDADLSTAFYGTLESVDDVDYFSLEADAGQRVYLSMNIPQIEGQDDFAPTMAVIGPELDKDTELPETVFLPYDAGALLLEAPEEATEFYEPFGNRNYWERQEAWVDLPAEAQYLIAVWDDAGMLGRYTFVYGDREVLGGEYGCNSGDYWTPVGAAAGTGGPAPSLLEGMLGLLTGG